MTEIMPHLACKKEEGHIVYFNGHMPVAKHDEKDLDTFRAERSSTATGRWNTRSFLVLNETRRTSPAPRSLKRT
jgi:hypothetical protein